MNAIVLEMKPFIKTSDDFFDLCAINRDMKLERQSTGEIIIRHPAGGITGSRNLDIQKRQVEVYRPDVKVEILNNPQELIGDPELPGFILNMRKIWSD